MTWGALSLAEDGIIPNLEFRMSNCENKDKDYKEFTAGELVFVAGMIESSCRTSKFDRELRQKAVYIKK